MKLVPCGQTVYCSEISKKLLELDQQYEGILGCVRSLPLLETTLITTRNQEIEELVSVTLIDANHCPGEWDQQIYSKSGWKEEEEEEKERKKEREREKEIYI